jgi:hypothetical protein
LLFGVIDRGRGRARIALGLVLGVLSPSAARAQECRPEPIRWQDDCSGLAGVELHGLDRLRYAPFGANGDVWMSLGGEGRMRVESVRNADFGIAGGPPYLQVSRRLQLHADVHSAAGPRAFAQLTMAEENGRRPGPRAQDQAELDLAQLFVDLPATVGEVDLLARLGRQEIDLSGNRLVTTRDGVNIRRTFNGAMLDAQWAGMRLSTFRLRPTEILRGAFDDRPRDTELFSGASLDLPRVGAGVTTLFLFDRQRPDARLLEASGEERRWTAGIRWAGQASGWDAYAQVARQWGQIGGRPIRAVGGWSNANYTFSGAHKPRIGATFAFASGDKRQGDGRVETFDPIYPSNYGLSDASLIYQSNFVALAGEGSAHFGRVELAAAGYAIGRYSTGDAVYAGGRPIAGSAGGGQPTAWLLQASARLAVRRRVELYGSVVRAVAGDGLTHAGGKDATYGRLQLTARF